MASSPPASSNPSARSSQFGTTPSTSFIKGMSKSPTSPPSPITKANSSPITSHHSAAADPESEQVVAVVVTTGITNKTKHLDIWRTSVALASDFARICGLLSFFPSSASLATSPAPPSQAITMMASSHPITAVDPESMMKSGAEVTTEITNKTKHLHIWRTSVALTSDFARICGLLSFFPSSASLAQSPPPPSQGSTMMDSTHPITAVDPESMMKSGQVTTNKTKQLDIGTSVVLASDFAWICGLLFSSDATKTKMMVTYRDLLIVITIIIIFSLCIGLIAFLMSVTFPVASRAMKVITISAGIVGAILSTFMIFLVLQL